MPIAAQPVDFASILKGGQGLVPDYAQQEAQKTQMMLQDAQARGILNDVTANERKFSREDQYQADLDAVLANPHDPNAIRQLLIKYPEHSTALKAGMDSLDGTTKARELTMMSEVYSAAASGKYDLAATHLERRITADKAAGQDTTHDEAILAGLRSEDPVERNAAVNMIGYGLAAATGEEHFGTVAGQLSSARKPEIVQNSAGGTVLAIDPTTRKTEVLYDSPFKEQVVMVDGRPYAYTPGTGGATGAPTPNAPQSAINGASIEQTVAAAIPGVTVTSRQRDPAKNKAVGGVPNSFHLTDQARDFVPPQGMGMGELSARIKRAMPGFDVINEGDHVHVEPRGQRAASSGKPAGKSDAQIRADAQAAIKAGADPKAVAARLRAWGIR